MAQSCVVFLALHWTVWVWPGLDCFVLQWIGLFCTAQDWIVLHWAGLDWTGLHWTGLECTAVDRTGMDCSGQDRNGLQWTGQELGQTALRWTRCLSATDATYHFSFCQLSCFWASWLPSPFLFSSLKSNNPSVKNIPIQQQKNPKKKERKKKKSHNTPLCKTLQVKQTF